MINNYVNINDRAYSIGEEFTDFVLVDKQRESVVLNIEKEYFKVVYKEYAKLGFKLKHVTHFNDNNGVTCVFIKETKK